MIAVARRHARIDRQREYVDFARVPPSQWKIHDRLENWARWCDGREGRGRDSCQPMFALYRSTDARREERLYGAETVVPIDKFDAPRIAVGVAALPDKHRRALNWFYPKGGRNSTNMARELALTMAGLAQMVLDARQMLINRGV